MVYWQIEIPISKNSLEWKMMHGFFLVNHPLFPTYNQKVYDVKDTCGVRLDPNCVLLGLDET